MYRKNKKLGQHFLVDATVLNTIVDLVCAQGINRVHEIGPGGGALTQQLLKNGLSVKAIEIDQRWCKWLMQHHANESIEVINQDALLFPWQSLSSDDVIVGNLPYQIASELMCQWVIQRAQFKVAILMMQKEVADRALAPVGSSAYGRLSVLVSTYFKVEAMLAVPPDAFDPPPKVQSSVISLVLRDEPLCCLEDLPNLQIITAAAFSQRRKKCRHGLAQLFSLEELKACDVDPDLRPQALTPQQFMQLSAYLSSR